MIERRRRLLFSAQGCARPRATLGNKRKELPTLKGLRIGSAANDSLDGTRCNIGWRSSATLPGCDFIFAHYPGWPREARANPGLQVVNAFGIHVFRLSNGWDYQVCHCDNLSGLLLIGALDGVDDGGGIYELGYLVSRKPETELFFDLHD